MIVRYDENGLEIFPIDRNHIEDSRMAEAISWPADLSDKARKVIAYFDDSAYLYKYKGNYVITDESGDLDYADGPFGGPRLITPRYEDIKTWLEEVADEFDAAEAAGEKIEGWDEVTEW